MKKFFAERNLQDAASIGGLPVYLLFSLVFFFIKPIFGLRLLISLLAIYAIAFAIRLFYFRQRPKRIAFKGLIQKLEAASFPSIHSARAAALAVIAFAFNAAAGIAFVAFGLLTGFALLRLRLHWLGDVLAGFCIGAAAALVMVLLV